MGRGGKHFACCSGLPDVQMTGSCVNEKQVWQQGSLRGAAETPALQETNHWLVRRKWHFISITQTAKENGRGLP